jgi:hypothetical protein
MDSQVLIELLSEILKRLDSISEVRSQMTACQYLSSRRQQSLENYRVAYNRQHGFPDHMVHPPNPDAEDEID